MASTYNGSVANLVDPLANSPLNSPSHAGQHTEINDALQTLGVWTSYTPDLLQPGAITKTVTYAKYTVFNKTCVVTVRLDVTGTGTTNNPVYVGLPVAPAVNGLRIGAGSIFDASTGTSYAAIAFTVGSSVAFVGDWSASNYWGGSPNLALAASDQIAFTATYETA